MERVREVKEAFEYLSNLPVKEPVRYLFMFMVVIIAYYVTTPLLWGAEHHNLLYWGLPLVLNVLALCVALVIFIVWVSFRLKQHSIFSKIKNRLIE